MVERQDIPMSGSVYFEDIENVYEELLTTDRRRAAEVAYAIGCLAKKDGQDTTMVKWAEKSIKLFEEIGINTVEDASPRFVSINGISMPSSFIHEDVVRQRLGVIKVNLSL